MNAKAVQPGGLRGRRVVSAGLRVVGGSVRGVVAASGGRGGIRRVVAVGIRAVAYWVRLKGCSDTPVNGPFRRPKGLRGGAAEMGLAEGVFCGTCQPVLSRSWVWGVHVEGDAWVGDGEFDGCAVAVGVVVAEGV